MYSESNLKYLAELLFLLIASIIAMLFLLPIWNAAGSNYPFYLNNFIYIFLFITLARYLFFLRWTPFSHSTAIKAAFMILCIPLFLFLIDSFYDFTNYIDEKGLESLLIGYTPEQIIQSVNYMKYQYIFFSTASIITTVLFFFRMIVSIYRVYNKKGNV
jgi:hypothetical protein